MRSLLLFLLALGFSLSMNVFAGGIADRTLENAGNSDEDVPSVRILREYSNN